MYFLIAAPPALLPRDQVPQDPQDRVRARQEGALRQRGESRHQARGEDRVSALHADRGGPAGYQTPGRLPTTGIPGV